MTTVKLVIMSATVVSLSNLDIIHLGPPLAWLFAQTVSTMSTSSVCHCNRSVPSYVAGVCFLPIGVGQYSINYSSILAVNRQY